MLWKENNILEIQNYLRWHIIAVMTKIETGEPWRHTEFYGQPLLDQEKGIIGTALALTKNPT
jgi:hypothetical protein